MKSFSECSGFAEASSPVDLEKKPFARLKEDVAAALTQKTKPEKPKKKEKPTKKLTKSKSTEQQPQTTPTFGATVSNHCASYFERTDLVKRQL